MSPTKVIASNTVPSPPKLIKQSMPSCKSEKKLKLSKFGTFSIRQKKSRIGRNPKTKETKVITSRDVVLFKPSKEFKEFINLKDYG